MPQYPVSYDASGFIEARARERIRRYLFAYGSAAAATGMSYLRGSAKRARTDTCPNLSQSSMASTTSALVSIHSNHEMVDRKREAPATYRLHPAKFLKMDKMLKSMFFPLMTTQVKFGISTFSGKDLENAASFFSSANASAADYLRTRGLYRGLAMFDVRTTNVAANRQADNALNAKEVLVANVYGGNNAILTPPGPAPINGQVMSHFRRFHSGPEQNEDCDGGEIVNEVPVLSADDVATQNYIRSIPLGSNLTDMEQNAVAGMCYADPALSQFRLRSVTATSSDKEQAANTGIVAGESRPDISNSDTTYVGPDPANYYSFMSDAVMRIVDGSLVLDIMNTEQTPCVVEIVIHSKKKNDLTKSQIYSQLFDDVNRYVRAKGVTDAPDDSANKSGGWQAFYDPNYPLLKVPSKARCLQYISEVHRSNHVLAPGQSKKVTIHLGNLWYKLGSKSDQIDGALPTDTTTQSFPKAEFNVGGLFVNIGHSGFEYPQSVTSIGNTVSRVSTTPSAAPEENHPYGFVPGAGFWVGKSNAPSSLSIDGSYTDKFYPMTFDRSPNNIINSGQPRPARFTGFGGTVRAAVPLATIIPQRVATSDSIVDPLV